jgi:1-acyl-sn-glycerol-3-phosphate acyltransferase
MGSYRLVLRRRLGFARLAAEAGAPLVPVIGVGEPDVTGPGEETAGRGWAYQFSCR